MIVQRYLQISFVQPFQHGCGIGEHVRIPRVARPSGTITRGYIGYMPVHVQYRYGQRYLLRSKFIHQSLVAFFGITVIPAPPVSESISRHGRGISGKAEKVLQSSSEVISIGKEVQIKPFSVGRCQISLVVHPHGAAVIQQGKSVQRHQTVLQFYGAIRFIQRAGCPLQIVPVDPVMPNTAVIEQLLLQDG